MNRSLCKKDDKTVLKNCIIVYSNYSLHIKLALGASDFNSSHLHSFLDNCHKDRCIRNGILRKGKYLESRNRRYRFYLRQNGNLVLTCNERPIWISFTKNDNVDFLHFNKEGTKFILRGKVWDKVKNWFYMIMECWFYTIFATRLSGRKEIVKNVKQV